MSVVRTSRSPHPLAGTGWIPWASILTASAAGLGDALCAIWDERAHRDDPDPLERTATWYQGTLIGVGAIGELAGWQSDVSEALLLSGSCLLTRQAAFGVSVAPYRKSE